MGIIQKQTIKGSVISYAGVLLGFAITGLMLPNWFSLEQNGIIKLLVANTVIFAQLASLGFTSVTTRMFTYFRDKQKSHHGFLLIGIIVTAIGFIISILIYYIVKDWLLLGRSDASSEMLARYIDLVIPMILATTFFYLFDNYYKVLYNVVKGKLYKEVYQRIFILAAIMLYYFDIINFQSFIWLYVAIYALPTLMLILSLFLDGQFSLKPDPAFLNHKLVRDMFSVGAFGILVGFSNMVILNIDSIMVNRYLGLSETGVYGITFFFGTLVIIPSRTLKKISSAFLADAWKDRNIEMVKDIYNKTSINQLFIGALIFIGIWGNIENVFYILPKEFEAGRYVIFIIAFSNLLEMGAGVSGTIISVSPHYRYMSHFMLILVILIIVTNIIFIPLLGVNGAAFASLLSFTVFILMRYLFLWYKYKMQPFGVNHLKVLIIALITYLLQLLIPQLHHYIFDIIIRSSVMMIIYLSLSVKFEVSDEVMKSYKKTVNFLKTLIGK